jgi:hypothetical protein
MAEKYNKYNASSPYVRVSAPTKAKTIQLAQELKMSMKDVLDTVVNGATREVYNLEPFKLLENYRKDLSAAKADEWNAITLEYAAQIAAREILQEKSNVGKS